MALPTYILFINSDLALIKICKMDTCRADTELFQCWETLMSRNNTYTRRLKFELVIYLFSEGATEVDYLEQFIRQNSKTENVKIIRRKICSDQIKLTQSAIDWAKNNLEDILNDRKKNSAK